MRLTTLYYAGPYHQNIGLYFRLWAGPTKIRIAYSKLRFTIVPVETQVSLVFPIFTAKSSIARNALVAAEQTGTRYCISYLLGKQMVKVIFSSTGILDDIAISLILQQWDEFVSVQKQSTQNSPIWWSCLGANVTNNFTYRCYIFIMEAYRFYQCIIIDSAFPKTLLTVFSVYSNLLLFL